MGRVGFWFRVLAAAIDVGLFLAAWVALVVALRPSTAVQSVTYPAGWLVYSSLEIFTAGTLGKLFLRLRIACPDSSAADRWRLFLRWSTKQLPAMAGMLFAVTAFPPFRLLSSFTGLLVLVGCLFASNDPRQAWHDQWAKTAVFRRPPKVVLPSAFPVLPPR